MQEAWSSSAPNLASPQCLKLGMVNLDLSVIFRCFTTTAFLPLAAVPLASPPASVWHWHSLSGLLVPHCHTSAFLSGPCVPSALTKFWCAHAPNPHGKLLISHSLLSHRIPRVPSSATFYKSGQLLLAKLWLFIILLTFTLASHASQIHYLQLLDTFSY